MKIATCSANLALLALIAAGLLAVPPEIQAQQAPPEEPENFAWITNTNGVTWKAEIQGPLTGWNTGGGGPSLLLAESERIAEIVVPEHAIIGRINVRDCVNLTNLVLHPARAVSFSGKLSIGARGSGLRNITCQKSLANLIVLTEDNWWAIQWTELPKMEIRTHSTDNGPEVEIIWRNGTLQIADAVNGEWKDYSGSSPLRVPLAIAKPQQFFRIRRSQ